MVMAGSYQVLAKCWMMEGERKIASVGLRVLCSDYVIYQLVTGTS